MRRLFPAFITWFPIALASCLLPAGCGGGQAQPGLRMTFDACAPLLVVTDPAITAPEAQGVESGLTLWNQLAGTALTTAAAGSPGDAGATPGARVPLHFQSAAAAFHGLYDDGVGQVFINDDLDDAPQALLITIAHELGHVFGLLHVPPAVRLSLMNAGNMTVLPTAADADALAALWGRCAPATAASTGSD